MSDRHGTPGTDVVDRAGGGARARAAQDVRAYEPAPVCGQAEASRTRAGRHDAAPGPVVAGDAPARALANPGPRAAVARSAQRARARDGAPVRRGGPRRDER